MVAPSKANASATALKIAGGEPIAPPSPIPLWPPGVDDGVSTCPYSIVGTWQGAKLDKDLGGPIRYAHYKLILDEQKRAALTLQMDYTLVGTYRVDALLGEGAFGSVFRARHLTA